MLTLFASAIFANADLSSEGMLNVNLSTSGPTIAWRAFRGRFVMFTIVNHLDAKSNPKRRKSGGAKVTRDLFGSAHWCQRCSKGRKSAGLKTGECAWIFFLRFKHSALHFFFGFFPLLPACFLLRSIFESANDAPSQETVPVLHGVPSHGPRTAAICAISAISPSLLAEGGQAPKPAPLAGQIGQP